MPVRLSSAVHFVGISGIGMSALARILLQRGYRVSGSSDRATALTARLAEEGATVAIGHDARNVGAAGTVVVSTAIGDDNPEVAAARERGVPIVHRGELLATLMDGKRGIAIAGTHGKTTTTAMIARVLERAGLDPSVAVGGERIDTGSNARDGAGEWFVAESDESDGSFMALHPEMAVLTNIDDDHVDSAAGLAELIEKFQSFFAALPANGTAYIGIDESRAAALALAPRAARTRTFGFARADVCAAGVRFEGFGSRAAIVVDGKQLGELRLSVPGAMNLLDALPAIAIALDLGVPFDRAADALASFPGVRRRFEILSRGPRMLLVDDYAHHPTAVEATIAAARAGFDGPLVVAFQPHRYSRTKALAADFARALRGADYVLLAPVYAASEPAIAGVDARTIGEPLRAYGTPVEYVSDIAYLPEVVLTQAPPGAMVLCLGAGSITAHAARLAAELEAEAVAQ
jgi:UDP-N-acetylmuramate--alanine ligase